VSIDLASLAASVFAEIEFFVVCFWADDRRGHTFAPSDAFSIESGQHFWSVSSKHPVSGAGLVRKLGSGYLMFRGYELELGVHTNSGTSALEHCASSDRFRNGCFAHIFVDDKKAELTARCDALGIAPLYHRTHDGCLFLASHPILISRPTDEPDSLCWLALLQQGSPLGDRSFYTEVKRLPMGSELIARRPGHTIRTWFDLNQFPDGTERIGESAFHRIEKVFQESVDRCLRIASAPSILPLSSGYDSRRIFGALQRKRADFVTFTAEGFAQKDGLLYEIDSVFAPNIARAYGIEWALVRASEAGDFAADFAAREMLVGTETFMHFWAVRVHRWLARQRPSLVWDGLGGDVFGYCGHVNLDLAETDTARLIEANRQIVLNNQTTPAIFGFLAESWPQLRDYRHACRETLGRFSHDLNQAEWGFFSPRTRRSTGSWSVLMQPPGQLLVFPYLDLAFVSESLRYHPQDKLRLHLQKECLNRFWPKLARFPGTNALPTDYRPISRGRQAAYLNTVQDLIWKPLSNSTTLFRTLELLSRRGRMHVRLASRVPLLRKRRSWFFDRFMELIGQDETQSPVAFASDRPSM